MATRVSQTGCDGAQGEWVVLFTDTRVRWRNNFLSPTVVYNSISAQITKPTHRPLNMRPSPSGEAAVLSVSKVVKALQWFSEQ